MTRSELLERAKPILFNTEMVRAIQNGSKTVTRRILKNQDPRAFDYDYNDYIGGVPTYVDLICCDENNGVFALANKIPYQVGDALYVRETWYYESAWHDLTAGEPDLPSGRYLHRYVYKAENPDYPVNVGVGAYGWKPSIHMPKEAARIFLRVTGVHVERLQDCGNMQAKDEGCNCCSQFARIWDSTIKKSDIERYGWNANPWVWVIEFEKVEVAE